MLRVRELRKRFGDLVALDGVDLDVGAGESVGFLGPNGAGKTTTMRSIMGIGSIDGGTVTWNGSPVDRATRSRFGYLPAERGAYPRMRVREQILYFAALAGLDRKAAAAAGDDWIERLGLTERTADEVQALSSGNQQRVQLAMTLVAQPELLLLDEPFAGLDPVATETIMAVLEERRRAGTAILFSSHQLDLVAAACERVVMVDHGVVVADGGVNELRSAAAHRVLDVGFAEPTRWSPAIPGVAEQHRTATSVRYLVPKSTSLRTLLADAESAGPVTAFALEPPSLSAVFLGHTRDRSAPGADTATESTPRASTRGPLVAPEEPWADA